MKTFERTVCLLLLGVLGNLSAAAQSVGGALSNTVLGGYGTVTWQGAADDDFTNDFSAGFSPVLLYSLGSDFLFESELEFGVSGETTTTSLEYAQIDYLGLENFIVSAGKFLVPFGLFGERYHPTWINKLPTSPLVYGHAHGGVAEGGAVLPILSDVGVMIRYRKPLGADWGLNVSAWISQGPRSVVDSDDHDDEVVEDDHFAATKSGDISNEGDAVGMLASDIPGVGFGVSYPDNNASKMVGARVGVLKGQAFEVYAGAFHARYDEDEKLDVIASHLSIDARRGLFEFKAEAVALWQDIEHESSIEVLLRQGYYAQLSRRVGAWEPVVRWSHVLEAEVENAVASPDRRDLSVGINYWLKPSIPLKIAYHADLSGDDHLIVQWAYGF